MKYLLLLTCFLFSHIKNSDTLLIVSWIEKSIPNVTYEDSRFIPISDENKRKAYSNIITNQLTVMSEYSKKILIIQNGEELIVLKDNLTCFSIDSNSKFEMLKPSENVYLFLNLMNCFFPVKYDDPNFVSISSNLEPEKKYALQTNISQCVDLMMRNFTGIKTMMAVPTSEKFGLVVRQDGNFYQTKLHSNAI